MPFKFTVSTVIVAISAGLSAFSAAFAAAGNQVTPGVVIAGIVALVGTFYHDNSVPKP